MPKLYQRSQEPSVFVDVEELPNGDIEIYLVDQSGSLLPDGAICKITSDGFLRRYPHLNAHYARLAGLSCEQVPYGWGNQYQIVLDEL